MMWIPTREYDCLTKPAIIWEISGPIWIIIPGMVFSAFGFGVWIGCIIRSFGWA